MEDPRWKELRRLSEEDLRRVGDELRSELSVRARREAGEREPQTRSHLVVPLVLSYVYAARGGLDELRKSVEFLLGAMPDLDIVPFIERVLGMW